MKPINVLELIKWTKLIARDVDFQRHHEHCNRVISNYGLWERQVIKQTKQEMDKVGI